MLRIKLHPLVVPQTRLVPKESLKSRQELMKCYATARPRIHKKQNTLHRFDTYLKKIQNMHTYSYL